MRSRRDFLGIGIALVVAATCVRLGFWQISRLHQRLARNASARAGWALPPIEIRENTPLDSVRNRRVHARVAANDVWRLLPRLESVGAFSILVVPVERMLR